MFHYQPDAVVAAFVRFNHRTSFSLQDLLDYDTELFVINDAVFANFLIHAGIPNPSTFDKSKLLIIAACAPGTFHQALFTAAHVYKNALDVGAIA